MFQRAFCYPTSNRTAPQFPCTPQDNPVQEVDEVDNFYDNAVQFVKEMGKASASSIKYRFKIGYDRTTKIIQQIEQEGIVSAPLGFNKPREVLIT